MFFKFQPIMKTIEELNTNIISCKQCDRLIEYSQMIANQKRRAYRDENYWGKPVPGWGDVNARLLIVGLAPGAHGANRTGRMFTGDHSGDFLYEGLYRAGFCNQAKSEHIHDGLTLIGAYLTNIVHCAPPSNKPTPAEIKNCRRYLFSELELLTKTRVILTFGQLAFTNTAKVLKDKLSLLSPKPLTFYHGCQYSLGAYILLGCYHPSQRNTYTGLMNSAMLDTILQHAKSLITP